MARLAGYGGGVSAPGAIAGVRDWSIDYSAAAIDSSGFDGGQPKDFTIGQTEWSGSFNGFKVDGTAPLAIGTILVCKFEEETATATQHWTGSVFITNVSAGVAVDGLVSYNYTFQGNGILTPATT